MAEKGPRPKKLRKLDQVDKQTGKPAEPFSLKREEEGIAAVNELTVFSGLKTQLALKGFREEKLAKPMHIRIDEVTTDKEETKLLLTRNPDSDLPKRLALTIMKIVVVKKTGVTDPTPGKYRVSFGLDPVEPKLEGLNLNENLGIEEIEPKVLAHFAKIEKYFRRHRKKDETP